MDLESKPPSPACKSCSGLPYEASDFQSSLQRPLRFEDGFLPSQLARRDADQPLLATLLGGTATALCAGLVPFEEQNLGGGVSEH